MTLRLQGDVAFLQEQLALRRLDERGAILVLRVEFWLLVFQHYLAINEVLDLARAAQLHLGADPLVTVERFGFGVHAVLGDERKLLLLSWLDSGNFCTRMV